MQSSTCMCACVCNKTKWFQSRGPHRLQRWCVCTQLTPPGYVPDIIYLFYTSSYQLTPPGYRPDIIHLFYTSSYQLTPPGYGPDIIHLFYTSSYTLSFWTYNADIDECKTNIDNCSAYADCTNTNGSFNCTCFHGYNGDGVNCGERVVVDSL